MYIGIQYKKMFPMFIGTQYQKKNPHLTGKKPGIALLPSFYRVLAA
jgi:hypothetical protein